MANYAHSTSGYIYIKLFHVHLNSVDARQPANEHELRRSEAH